MLIVTKRSEKSNGKDFIRCKAYSIDAFTVIDCWGNEVIATHKDGKNLLLGHYDTNERATEVFDEIIAKYGEYYQIKGGQMLTVEAYIQPQFYTPPKVYHMPEK